MRYFLSIFLISFFLSCTEKNKEPVYLKLTGITMGVIHYSITYLDDEVVNHQKAIDSLLTDFNQSLSTYVKDSEISTLNNEGELTYQSEFFYPVLKSSQEIYQITSGAYDPTVGPLVNLWGFGPGKKQIVPDSISILKAKEVVGFHHVKFNETNAISDKQVRLDFSAIAKGYAVDVVAEYLRDQGMKNYFIEIGGEVACQGVNPSGKTWQIGIYDPRVEDDPTKERAAVVKIKNKSVATSGNYRNYYEVDGKKYGHTISPYTGYPVQHSLLSASVFANDCMTADAYATAFMVMGLEKAISIVENSNALEAYLIYADDSGQLKSYASAGIEDMIFVD